MNRAAGSQYGTGQNRMRLLLYGPLKSRLAGRGIERSGRGEIADVRTTGRRSARVKNLAETVRPEIPFQLSPAHHIVDPQVRFPERQDRHLDGAVEYVACQARPFQSYVAVRLGARCHEFIKP